MPPPDPRVFGVETEFGCLVADDSMSSEQAVDAIKDHVFYEQRLGAIDLQSRDSVFEPARSGGFLINGSRLYIDAVGSHLEYATAECQQLTDLVANDRAGQRHIVRAIRELGLEETVSVYNNAVDHFGGHTFGCHENYLMLADDEFFNYGVHLLYPFLVTRQIFAGVGRVGGHKLTRGPQPSYEEISNNPIDYIWVSHVYSAVPDETVDFQLSQRADHILKTMASRVRFNRSIINPKWETLYSYGGKTRLHILFGEANQNEVAYALKIGSTALVLRLVEQQLISNKLILASPVIALRNISRDPTYKWVVLLSDGDSIGAIDLQRQYLSAAKDLFAGESEQTDWILREWERALDGLERDPMSMDKTIDWVAKKKIVEQYRQAEGLDWHDDALQSVDLEYHNIDPERSLYHALQEMESVERLVKDSAILNAMVTPPQDTRAKGRSELVEGVIAKGSPLTYYIDWDSATVGDQMYSFLDPIDVKSYRV